MSQKTTMALVAAFLIAAAGTTAQAQLIAADGFNASDYEDVLFPGDKPLDQSGTLSDGMPIVNPGWVDDGEGDSGPAAWNLGTGNLKWDTDAVNPTLRSPSVTYDDNSTGKGLFDAVPAGGFGVAFRAGDRKMDPYTPADTYYFSMLVNAGGLRNDGAGLKQHALAGFVNAGWDSAGLTNDPGATLTPFGLMVGFHGQDADSNPAADGQVDLIIRTRQGDIGNPILTDTVLVAGASDADISNITYLVMMKLQINVDAGSFDRLTYWVNPGDVTSEATASGSTSVTGTLDTLAMNATSDIDRFRIVINSFENRNLFFDEVRMAYDFESLRGDLPTSGLAGDYNNDSIVDAADYALWRNGGPLINETESIGVVDAADYTAWRGNYGATPQPAPAGAAAAPEPTAWLLCSLAAFFVGQGPRRR